VAIGAYDEEIGEKGQRLRQQKLPHLLSSGRQTFYLYLHTVMHQVECDIRPRLLTVTSPLALIVNYQDLYSFCAGKQGQGIRYSPDGLASGVPTYEDAADLICRAGWWNKDDWSAGTQYQGFREPRRAGRLAALRAGNNH
jgi:hypothetical protein